MYKQISNLDLDDHKSHTENDEVEVLCKVL